MIKKKSFNEFNEKVLDSDDKKILSISLPVELYQLLLQKVGKGNIGNYVREAIETKLKEEEMILMRAYKLLEENSEYQEEVRFFQKNHQEYHKVSRTNQRKSTKK